MGPVSAFSIASSAISIVSKILPTIVNIKEEWESIKSIDETNTKLVEELDAFQSSLTVIASELRKEDPPIESSKWWSSSRITDLLNNSVKTGTRLDWILRDVSREKRLLPNIRSYYRSSMYEKEIGHLIRRLKTYTTCLHLSTTIVTIHSQTDSTATKPSGTVASTSDLFSATFHESIAATEDAISKVLHDIQTICAVLDQRLVQDQQPNLVRDSEELVEIVATVISAMTSVASIVPLPETEGSTVSKLPTEGDWESVSVSGSPQSRESNHRIQTWSQGVRSPEKSDETSEILWAMSKMSTFGDDHMDMRTQLIKHRFELAQRLCGENKFGDAVPHLRKTLNAFTDQTAARQDVQLLLAKALLEVKPVSADAEKILTEIAENSTSARRGEALHLLACAQMELHPNDMALAKESCALAVDARASTFGRRHEQTLHSIGLMVQLCTLTNDSDAAVWLHMLPEAFHSSTPDSRMMSPMLHNSPASILKTISTSPVINRSPAVSNVDVEKSISNVVLLEHNKRVPLKASEEWEARMTELKTLHRAKLAFQGKIFKVSRYQEQKRLARSWGAHTAELKHGHRADLFSHTAKIEKKCARMRDERTSLLLTIERQRVREDKFRSEYEKLQSEYALKLMEIENLKKTKATLEEELRDTNKYWDELMAKLRLDHTTIEKPDEVHQSDTEELNDLAQELKTELKINEGIIESKLGKVEDKQKSDHNAQEATFSEDANSRASRDNDKNDMAVAVDSDGELDMKPAGKRFEIEVKYHTLKTKHSEVRANILSIKQDGLTWERSARRYWDPSIGYMFRQGLLVEVFIEEDKVSLEWLFEKIKQLRGVTGVTRKFSKIF